MSHLLISLPKPDCPESTPLGSFSYSFAILESGLGVSILPQLILKRVPYDIAIKELDIPAHRDIALAMRCKKTAPLAVRKFIEYLKYRKG